eukprot:5054005-Prymnesium_polylepis.2
MSEQAPHGGGGGDGTYVVVPAARTPQSRQSVEYRQRSKMLPAPPSSHSPSAAKLQTSEQPGSPLDHSAGASVTLELSPAAALSPVCSGRELSAVENVNLLGPSEKRPAPAHVSSSGQLSHVPTCTSPFAVSAKFIRAKVTPLLSRSPCSCIEGELLLFTKPTLPEAPSKPASDHILAVHVLGVVQCARSRIRRIVGECGPDVVRTGRLVALGQTTALQDVVAVHILRVDEHTIIVRCQVAVGAVAVGCGPRIQPLDHCLAHASQHSKAGTDAEEALHDAQPLLVRHRSERSRRVGFRFGDARVAQPHVAIPTDAVLDRACHETTSCGRLAEKHDDPRLRLQQPLVRVGPVCIGVPVIAHSGMIETDPFQQLHSDAINPSACVRSEALLGGGPVLVIRVDDSHRRVPKCVAQQIVEHHALDLD